MVLLLVGAQAPWTLPVLVAPILLAVSPRPIEAHPLASIVGVAAELAGSVLGVSLLPRPARRPAVPAYGLSAVFAAYCRA